MNSNDGEDKYTKATVAREKCGVHHDNTAEELQAPQVSEVVSADHKSSTARSDATQQLLAWNVLGTTADMLRVSCAKPAADLFH